MSFWNIYCPMLAALLTIEALHFAVGMWLSWKQNKQIQRARDEFARAYGEQNLPLYDMGLGGNMSMIPLGGTEGTLPTAGGTEDPGDRSHGQYL